MTEVRATVKIEKKEEKKSIDLVLTKDPVIERNIVMKMKEIIEEIEIETMNLGIEEETIQEIKIETEKEIEEEEVEVAIEEIVIDINMKRSKKILTLIKEDKFKESGSQTPKKLTNYRNNLIKRLF